jgi:hypothetical protein
MKVKGILQLVAASGLCASAGHAQPCTPPATANGPDVIVGEVNGVSNYTGTGVGGLDAISLGTTSCNIGNVNANWISNTNQHPVVGQNLFKYKVSNYSGAGTNNYARFEQIGQSWLKHTFAAFDQNACCTDCASQGGLYNFLRVHCSDPYTSARNGSQSGLGPKWQVNAHTGVFPYPPANPSFAGNVMRRLEYSLADAEATAGGSGAAVRYFGECQYVTLDDATQGNQNNNTSYREVSMSTTGTFPNASESNALILSSTQRSKLAVQAWKVIDPTVTETETFVNETSGTGRLILSSKATDLGNGFWHYEYALANQNSEVSVGGFSVPLPAGAVVQNIGFRDVAYRDGDGILNVNIDGTDWTGNVSGSAISWNTVTFALNANGNAVRWGTTYNFRFDANVAPAPSGNATLTTWKTVANYAVAAQVPSGNITQGCYANCDSSTTVPCLNVADFSCFLNAFAAGDSYANCDNSTTAPVLNVADFSCFLNTFAAGCSGC